MKDGKSAQEHCAPSDIARMGESAEKYIRRALPLYRPSSQFRLLEGFGNLLIYWHFSNALKLIFQHAPEHVDILTDRGVGEL